MWISFMFLRCKTIHKKGKQYKYYQVVANKRINGRVRQRVITTMGTSDQAANIAKALVASRLTSTLSDELALIDLSRDIAPVWSREYGLPFVYQRIFQACGLADIIDSLISQHKKLSFDLQKTTFNLILNRLMQPASEHKIATQWNKTVYHEFTANIELQHLYRTVGLVSQHKEEMEESLFAKTRDLFHQKIDLAFFDTTSTYLYGTQSEELAQYGRSKDKRSDCKQLVVGVLLGPDSIPIGCEILPGNTADVKTIPKIIQAVRQRFSINKIILVGDGGMNSQDNRKLLEQEKLEYILGTRMRSIKVVKEYLQKHYPLNLEHAIVRNNKDDLRYQEISLNGQRYIIIYNGEEARRQKHVRQDIIAKLEKQLKEKGLKSLIKNKGQRKYLKINDKVSQTAGIDWDKLKSEEVFDGLFVCETNAKLATEEIVIQYKNLYQVERAFRNLKDIIEIRPIYHQVDDMIRGHVFISFLALYLEMYLKKQLLDNDVVRTDINELIAEVKAIKAIKIQVKGKAAVMRTELGKNVHQLFKALSIRPPDRIIEKWK